MEFIIHYWVLLTLGSVSLLFLISHSLIVEPDYFYILSGTLQHKSIMNDKGRKPEVFPSFPAQLSVPPLLPPPAPSPTLPQRCRPRLDG